MLVAVSATAAYLCSSCVSTSVVPITGRIQANSVSNRRLNAAYAVAYNKVLSQRKELPSPKNTKRVRRVGFRLQAALTRYFIEIENPHILENYDWEYNVVVEPERNASCGPGGKILVNTGMLELTTTDDLLAAVLAHEIAHAVANHTAEQMSDQMIQNAINGFMAGTSGRHNSHVQSAAKSWFSIMSTYGFMLPHSRFQESEADHMGLIIMSIAGYKPDACVELWERMQAANDKAVAQWKSTHPSHPTRIKQLRALIPTVMPIYNKMKNPKKEE